MRQEDETNGHESYHRDVDEGRHGPTDIFYIEGGSFVREWRHLDDDDEKKIGGKAALVVR